MSGISSPAWTQTCPPASPSRWRCECRGPPHAGTPPNASQLQKHLCYTPLRGLLVCIRRVFCRLRISHLYTFNKQQVCTAGGPQDWGSGVWAERSVSRLHLFSPAHPPYTYLCLPRAQRRSVLCDDLLALGILGGEKRVEGGGVERMELMGAQPGWVVSGAFSGGRGEPGLLHVQRVVKRTDGQGEAGCGHLGPMDIMHAILKNFAIVSNVRCSECSRTRSRFLASFEQSTVCSTGSEFPGQSTGVGCLGKVPTSLGLSPLLCPSWAPGGDQVGGRRPSTLLSPQAHTLNSSLVFLLCLLWFNLATLSVFLRTVPRLSRYLCIS